MSFYLWTAFGVLLTHGVVGYACYAWGFLRGEANGNRNWMSLNGMSARNFQRGSNSMN